MDVNKLKNKVDRLAKATGVPHQNIYDMYFFERFLCRLSQSTYYNNFVLKGGFLLENIVGIKSRTTMDIDLKAVGITMSDERIVEVFSDIASIKNDDEIEYSVSSVSDITADMKYSGKSVKIEARLKNLKKTFTVDIAQGDCVTPYPDTQTIKSSLDDSKFSILAYNAETVIAEKFETLISKGMSNSRAKDLFDIHILMQRQVDIDRLNAALINTFFVRQTRFNRNVINNVLDGIFKSDYRREVFDQYVQKHSFAHGVSFDVVMQSAYAVCDAIKVNKVDLPRSSAKVTLVRHGEDEQHRLGGWSDNKLTEKGVLQVESLACSLSHDYDVILSSDLPRARQTAEIIAVKLNRGIEYNADLREVNNGDFKNMDKEAFNALKYKRFVDLEMDEAYPNGESPQSFYERIESVFSKILQKYDGKKILVVTHGGVITVIECLIHSWQYSNLLRLAPSYATAVEISTENLTE